MVDEFVAWCETQTDQVLHQSPIAAAIG